MASDNSIRSNRLSSEKSPYLLQHKDNPVNWHPWNEEAFERAVREDKPVFLSIGYSTCHWCHVMEHESFESEATALLLNEHFVSIKVDREERPDIDSVYMSYVQAVTGSGGWPMSVFLTPDKKPFYGGTYFPPEDRWGMPGFPTLLKSIAESWKQRRNEILDSADSAVKFLSVRPAPSEVRSVLSVETMDQAFARFEAGFDEQHGGFGRAPKFPRSHALSFLLRYWVRTKNRTALAIVERTLDAMAAGGIHDQLAGGFHRYSVDALWRIPHFEKMMYDQALLVQTYTEAYQATGNAVYRSVAEQTLDYVLACMTSPEGGFYSAEDADSEDPHDPSKKREGAYYVWRKAEIEEVLGADAELFAFHYGIEPGGNAITDPHREFEAQNVLYRAHTLAETAEHFKKTEPKAESILERGRAKLLGARNSRPRPHLDDKVLTDWNALAIAAFAKASVVFGRPAYLEAAQTAAVFIGGTLKDASGSLLHRYRDGESAGLGNLNDHAYLLDAYLYLYEADFDPGWLERATKLADRMITGFWDEPAGGFYLTANDAEVLISRPKEIYDGAMPSGNSIAALALARLAAFTGQSRYTQVAARTIEAFSEAVSYDPSNYPAMLQALDQMIGPSREIVVAAVSRAEAMPMLAQAREGFYPNRVVLLHVPETEKLKEIALFVSNKRPLGGKTAVYVCRNHSCQLPAVDAEALRRNLE